MWAACAVLLIPLGSGCLHYRLGFSPRPPLALPEVLAAGRAHSPSNAPAELQWQDESPVKYRLAQVKLSAPVAAATTNKTLELEYYLPGKPSAGPVPVIIILPVSAGEHYPLERHFARYFTRRGYAAVIVHRERERDPQTGQQVNELLKQSVFDNMLVIDWLQTRQELDGTRIGVLGTSMGAIKGSLLTAVDSRVKASVLGLVGGDVPYILTYSREGGLRGGGIVGHRNAYLVKHHIRLEQFRKRLEETVTYDPQLFAPSVDPKKVLLFLGALDTIVPFKKGWELRRAMGKPETVVMFSGHYTTAFYLLYIRSTAFDFFKGHFDWDSRLR
jgi:dienelactone hydrolase family protein